MKRHFKRIILPAALVLCVVLSAVALAESSLAGLWNSGCDLLFRTHNVTVKGEASFSLDGEHFKTMELNYVQEGCNSYYGLKLLTPREDGTQRETGWTIIADRDGYYVMEAFYPGTYRTGTDDPQDTLLRRTVQLDALTDLGGLLLAQIEPLLPENAVTAAEAEGGKTIHVALKDDQIPALAVSALNTAAGYLCNRWFSGSYDRALTENATYSFENYFTVTQALTDGTARWELKGVDVIFTLDDQGRLTGLRGEAQVQSVFWDGTARQIEVKFDFTASDYGTSRVKAFDPADYDVVLYWDWIREQGEEPIDDAAWEEWTGRAEKLMKAQGYSVLPDEERTCWNSEEGVTVTIANADQNCLFIFSQDGKLLTFQNISAIWLQADEESVAHTDVDGIESGEELIRAFLAEENPAFAEDLSRVLAQSAISTPEGSRYLTFSCLTPQSEAFFVVRTSPSPRIEYYLAD